MNFDDYFTVDDWNCLTEEQKTGVVSYIEMFGYSPFFISEIERGIMDYYPVVVVDIDKRLTLTSESDEYLKKRISFDDLVRISKLGILR